MANMTAAADTPGSTIRSQNTTSAAYGKPTKNPGSARLA